VVDGARAAEFAIAPVTSAGAADHGIAVILALALLGGLILNFMPCVFPVLSIKAFSVVKAAGNPDAISTLVASGKTVLVDVTASWCLTCKVNELSVLDSTAVRSGRTTLCVCEPTGVGTTPE
jgi:thiol:disulfide interchange protein